MSIETRCYEKPGYVFVVVAGLQTQRNGRFIKEETKQRQGIHLTSSRPTRLVVAHIGDDAVLRWITIGTRSAVAFQRSRLVKPETINRFAEDVAVNRGTTFRVFTDRKEAVRWLLKGVNKPDAGDDR